MLVVRDVAVDRDGTTVLDRVSLEIARGERWVVLGPNGGGKTTLLRVLALATHPSRGRLWIDGRELGSFDTRTIRPRLAWASASLASELRPAMSARDAVMSAVNGALETWWHDYDDGDADRALAALDSIGVAGLADRPLGSLSSGEMQRVLLARALVVDPLVVLLDEPSARLDIAGREALVRTLDDFAARFPDVPSVVVTHHVDEIPASTTHCALLRGGRIVGAGPLDDTLDSESLSGCFGLDLRLEHRENGRLLAYAV